MPDGATLLVNLSSGQIYETKGPGARLWSLLSEGKTVDQAASEMLDEFDVSPERLADETSHLLEQLAGAGLTVPVESR